MTSRSIPIPLRGPRAQSRARIVVHAPSARVVFITLVAILILFRWLHLILALQIATTSIDIQSRGQDLSRLERENALLLVNIAAAKSPTTLAERATQLGYQPRPPLYLVLDQPISTSEGMREALPTRLNETRGATAGAPPQLGYFSTWLETGSSP